jgi:5-hydroxyisourate hydrolase-like protein (transthyretin family)
MMRLSQLTLRLAFLLVASSFSFAALAQRHQYQQPQTASIPGSYRIAGVLVNSSTGAPVQRATVEALKEDDSHAVASCATDSEGRFVLDHLAASKYQLTASKRGFRTAFYDEHDQYSTAIVTGADQDTTHLQFKLMPQATLRGVVTGDDGDPINNARVMLFRRPEVSGTGQRLGPGDTTQTDDTGAYEFSNLAAGQYLLAVVAEPWFAVHDGAPGKRNPALDVAFPVTYFDSTTEESSATPIVLAGGSRAEANISLHAVPALHVNIAVPRKPDGSLARPELQQTIFGTVISSTSAGFIDALQTGSVEMNGIAPGRYQLTQGDPPRVVELDLTSNQQVDPNTGSPTSELSGRVRTLSGAPPPDEATVSLQRIDNTPGQYQYAAAAHQGRFKIEAVPPGDWDVQVTSGDGARSVVAAALGSVQHVGSLITLRDHAPQLTVTITDSESDVEGFAKKSGQGASGAMIVLLPRNPARWRALTRRDQSNSDGSFALHQVAPGDYSLVAIEDGWSLDWTSPEAMARYLLGAANVRVTESSGKLVRLGSSVAVQQR